MTKGFKITIIGLSIALVGIIAATITIFVTRERPLVVPSQPSLIVVGQERFLDTAVVLGAAGYIFRIDNVEFTSNESTFRVTGLFLEARNYVVEVAAVASKAKNNSAFSQPIIIANRILLPTPLLSYNAETKVLSWSTSGSDVTYQLVANGVVLESALTARTYDCSNMLGAFNFSVKAIPNDDEFSLPSVKSNVVNITVYQQLDTPTIVSFNDASGLLTFTPPANASGLNILYEVVYNGASLISITPTVVGNNRTIDLSLFFEITTNPSISIKALGAGYYLDSVLVQLNNS